MGSSILDYLFRYLSQTFIEEDGGMGHQWWEDVHNAWRNGAVADEDAPFFFLRWV